MEVPLQGPGSGITMQDGIAGVCHSLLIQPVCPMPESCIVKDHGKPGRWLTMRGQIQRKHRPRATGRRMDAECA